jgi:hypothetical protein
VRALVCGGDLRCGDSESPHRARALDEINELHYHMLVPKRVLEDGGLHLYREPWVAAIPQMAFQLGLSAVSAAGFPEAGNVISWGLGVVLVMLIAGVVADNAASRMAGWLTGAIAAVGLYPAVWHVTSGAHALGDLAIAVGCLWALLPRDQLGELGSRAKLVLICLASCTAASTKLSLLPLALVLTGIAVIAASKTDGWIGFAAIAAAVWAVFYGPALVWTMKQSGSPFGPATAAMFHSTFWDARTLEHMRASHLSQDGWRPIIEWMLPSLSVGIVAAFAVLAWPA